MLTNAFLPELYSTLGVFISLIGNNPSNGNSIIRFVVNILVCYLLAYGVAKPVTKAILSDFSVKIQENIAMLIGMGLFIILNYFGQRFFAFKDNAE